MWGLLLFLLPCVLVISENVEVFLDHGGHPYHAEVFYCVANLILQLHPSFNITFVINQEYSRQQGLDKLYDKYGRHGPINPFYYRFEEMPWYLPLAGREYKRLLCNSDENHPKFWLRAVITIANLPGVYNCLYPYANLSNYLFIIHHPTKKSGGGGYDGHILSWTNAYVASNSIPVLQVTGRKFSPALLPLQPIPPNCNKPPIFICQGDPQRRNFAEIEWMLETDHSFLLKLMNRYLARRFNDTRVQHIENSSLLTFHESFLGSAFILPLISPMIEKTRSYFYGRSTSSIAFGVHFHLRFLSHIAVESVFHHELTSRTHYWHDGRKPNFLKVLRSALNDYSRWCNSTEDMAWA